jgi:Flp pilus assembly protein TadB
MAGFGARIGGLLATALAIAILVLFVKQVLILVAALLLLLTLAAVLFYVRMRMALRRLRRAFGAGLEEAARRQGGGPQGEGRKDAIDAEFKVKDE